MTNDSTRPSTTEARREAGRPIRSGTLTPRTVFALLPVVAVGCLGPDEAPTVDVPVVVDTDSRPVTTNLGYEVVLSRADVVVENLVFTVAGEVHSASLLNSLSELIVSRAYAHPGHFQGVDVTGELPGRFFLAMRANASNVARGAELYAAECARCHGEFVEGLNGPSLGGYPGIATAVREGPGAMPRIALLDDEVDATQLFLGTRIGLGRFLEGTYESGSLTFSMATVDDGLGADELLGHTAVLRGVASREDERWSFVVLIDAPEARQLVGIPFVADLPEESNGAVSLRLELADPLEGDTMLDDVEFADLDVNADGEIRIEPSSTGAEAAYNVIRRRFLSHDHWVLRRVE